MPRTPKRLFGPAQLTAATATKYTTPAATITVVRKIRFYNADTVPRTVTLSIGADAAGTRIVDAQVIAAGQPLEIYGPITLVAAEILAAFADVTLKVTLTIDGDEYTAGP